MSAITRVIVESIKPYAGAGSTRAFADIVIGDIRVCEVRIVQRYGREPFVHMPARLDGKHKLEAERTWHPVVQILDYSLKKEIEAAVLEEFAKLEQAAPVGDGVVPKGLTYSVPVISSHRLVITP